MPKRIIAFTVSPPPPSSVVLHEELAIPEGGGEEGVVEQECAAASTMLHQHLPFEQQQPSDIHDERVGGGCDVTSPTVSRHPNNLSSLRMRFSLIS